MKNNLIVKASLFTLILAFVVSVSFAVTEVMKKDNHVKSSKTVITQTWYYQLNSSAAEDIDNPANYATTKPDPNQDCGTGPVLCSIVDTADPFNSGQPEMSQGLVSENLASYSPSNRPPVNP